VKRGLAVVLGGLLLVAFVSMYQDAASSRYMPPPPPPLTADGVPATCEHEATSFTTTYDNLGCNTESYVAGGKPPYTVAASPNEFRVGTTTVTLTITDKNNAPVTKPQTVIVKDTTAPVLTIPPDITLEATGKLSAFGPDDYGRARAHDTVAGDIVPTNDVKDEFPIGDTLIVWTASDGTNTVTGTQTVTVEDSTPPTLVAPPNVVVGCTKNPSTTTLQCPGVGPGIRTPTSAPISSFHVRLGIPRVSDLVDAAPLVSNDAPKTYPAGETIVTWNATDGESNTVLKPQTVTVTEFTGTPSLTSLTTKKTYDDPGGRFYTTFGTQLEVILDELLLVGNPLDSTKARYSGAVHLFNTSESITTPIRTFYHQSPAAYQYFGSAVTALDDVFDDTRFAVGAYGSTRNNSFRGEVEIYNATDGKYHGTLSNPNTGRTANGDYFGLAVKSLYGQLAVSAMGHDDSTMNNVGRVYLYTTSDTVQPHMWKHDTLANPNPTAKDYFGYRMASYDGVNERLYVASREHDQVAKAVYVFDGTATLLDTIMPPAPSKDVLDHSYGLVDMEVSEKDGSLFVGEGYRPSGTNDRISFALYHYTGAGVPLGIINPPGCCHGTFGMDIEAVGDYIYVKANSPTRLNAINIFNSDTHAFMGSFKLPNQVSTWHDPYGKEVIKMLNSTIVVISERADPSPPTRRIHLVDQWVPADASGTSSDSVFHADSSRLAVPELLTTTAVGNDKVKLAYNMDLNPHVVDIWDYEINGGRNTVVAAEVDGKSVTLTYMASATPGGSSGGSPTVELTGSVAYVAPAPAPAPAPIEFTMGGLDGSSLNQGESQTFSVTITRVEGGGSAIVMLSGQPDFVTVQNTAPNAATVTINASHTSALPGDYAFTVMASVGSDPVTKSVVITVT